MSLSPAGAPTPTDAGSAHPAPTELLFKGRPVAKERVAAWFLLGSLAVAVFGLGLNYYLTDGTWFVPEGLPGRGEVATGDGDAYVTAHPYDIATTSILILSLTLLGAGFLRAMVARSTALNVGRVLLLVAVGLWLAGYAGLADDYLLVWITLAVAAPFILRAYIEKGAYGHAARGVGFVLFGLYWATQGMRLYTIENGDFVNLTFTMLAVPFYNYFAYHEILSAQRGEAPRALVWLAGVSFITTGVYFATHKIQAVSEWLILRVAEQTEWMLHLFGQDVARVGGDPDGSRIFYPMFADGGASGAGWFAVQIILACTAIQSIMIFVGGILALRAPTPGEGSSGKATAFHRNYFTYNPRRFWALALTVPLIYVLNLFRNTIIIWMSGQDKAVGFTEGGTWTNLICDTFAQPCVGDNADNYAAFWFSHNIIGKGGSLVALIIIAFIVFRILPELYDSIIGLLDLKRRRGPLERWFGEKFGRKGGGGEATPAEPTAPASSAPAAPAADQG